MDMVGSDEVVFLGVRPIFTCNLAVTLDMPNPPNSIYRCLEPLKPFSGDIWGSNSVQTTILNRYDWMSRVNFKECIPDLPVNKLAVGLNLCGAKSNSIHLFKSDPCKVYLWVASYWPIISNLFY